MRSKSRSARLSSSDCVRAKASSLEYDGAEASTPNWIEASSQGQEGSGSTLDVDAPGEKSGFH